MEQEYEKVLVDTLRMLVEPLVEDLTITVSREGDQYRVNVNSDKNELLVGHRGENIKAIQHITRVIVHIKFPDNKTHFLIDVGEFKKVRESLINSVVPEIAKTEVIEKGSSIILVKLNGYERKMVHNLLDEIKGVETTSIGEGSERKLMIRPTEDSAGVSSVENAIFIDIEDYKTIVESDESKNGEMNEERE
ncbi:KH domain-containing protein [Candidatus Gracilibacteria bacterium]|nr:KH domain-containing protein [Candidatus Gracilibacteria bacterium]NJS41240.1 KH domain-containing protein [Candidatus Gracilibacteria bacterium]